VVVRIPPMDRVNPAAFLYRIEKCQLIMPLTEARVTIHRSSGTIVLSGDAEISPAVISQKGLTITTTVPPLKPTPDNPQVQEQRFVAVDPENRGGARLRDLVNALNLLRVPSEDRITIIQKMHENGQLHATLIVED
jgi:flagellar basal body P-ring protein FlgI